ncbi:MULTISPECIES: glutamate racemase [Psychrobacter]|jgi:glutamate racemase|uniref:glutamate racemase n=1 Tax=Psychrobacter TaxID=497 RepID=UPI000C33F996|nr:MULTISPECIES: glutamate racemase [Psychrobacter]MBA6244283.1 glutamate racemase [Psychrobacter sp. Urea-trap-18]MBA6286583.1 glutamate racemase [Psychrobacter sp. Urea-trap-16]MBA6317580.1 glutamate racemase [Psychrobacter sp. Urea-trap-20]MBA6334312.1 glutamate racemase [Psychrobacter sp. Urea-trap-19]PKG60545.1 glutamate racemase [Psychrobacter sp. Choline-3u-12]
MDIKNQTVEKLRPCVDISVDQSLKAIDLVDVNKHAGNTVVSDKNRSAPIGVFDSGVGGLSVYLHLAQQLPTERYVYYADTLNVPYGNRDSEDIEALTLKAVEWLHQQGCKLIVIACNSASAYALDTARRCYPHIPIVGLVPALKPAVLASKSAHVAVLATKATLNGTLLNDVIVNFAKPNNTVVTKYFDPQLVPWVEAGMSEQDETAERLRQQIRVFANEGVDQLVLGCTHYPFFKTFLLDEIVQQQLSIQVIDSGQAIAERVRQLLIANNLSASLMSEKRENLSQKTSNKNTITRPPLTFHATKYSDRLCALVERLLGTEMALQYYSH